MSNIKVLNVGQGDCVVFNDLYDKCVGKQKTVYVDLGPGNVDITKEAKDDEIDIFLTHHHHDHMGGLRYFIGNKFYRIKNIYVPDYLNELTFIAKAILNLKGIKSAKDCLEFINELNDIVDNYNFLESLSESRHIQVCHQGDTFYGSMKCLNPPQYLDVYKWIEECDENEMKELFNTLFESEFAEELIEYVYRYSHIDNEEDRMMYENRYNKDKNNHISRRNYVVDFIMRNRKLLMAFDHKPTRKRLSKIYRQYMKTCHDTCLVLRYEEKNFSFLLTGDASEKVFKRLICSDELIYSQYLKVPHHGSKKNLTNKILSYINPKVAIISHNNGRFGKAKDSLPNQEILDMLMKRNTKILITNDVIKNGKIIMKRKNHCSDSYIEIK
ncbi:MBL fold metallo-hydrolase [Massilimicrobiota sp. An134]|uniref:ComEC/Rec2 family competence protein n=1 Tax=Massilimicrobiota sp. An134 TaxID=1965557 RepID=UPI000B3980B7|nr:MBL fold metallo-hydrolase [Massilimicrobiota sp. An134]OUQ30359.1 hypothetical protein B5E79_03670 [Massilimicrobiota sp. An134]